MKILSLIFILFATVSESQSALQCHSLFIQGRYTDSEIIEKIKKSNSYLDERNKEWADTKRCICCHTTLPYILSRGLDVQSASNYEKLRASAVDKVENPDKRPWYASDRAGYNSNPTEAVLNALTLVMFDLAQKAELQAVTIKSIDRILEHLGPEGRLHWLDFKLEPFESKNAELWGNSLAVLTIELAQKNSTYKASELKYNLLKDTILKDPALLNLNEKSTLLWAHSISNNVLSKKLEEKFIYDLKASQNENGSWNQDAFLNQGKKIEDVYSTSIALLALLKMKINTQEIDRAASWLISKQETGQPFGITRPVTLWPSLSMNREGSRLNNLFSSDAATGYARLALQTYTELNK